MKILLPIDIVHAQTLPIEQLDNLVKLKGKDVILLYVKEELPSYEHLVDAMGDFKDDWHSKVELKAKETFALMEDKLKAIGAKASHKIVSGPSAMLIDAVARDTYCDLTVVSPGKHSQVETFFLGSVSSSVVKHGPNSTLIMRAPEKPITNVLIATDGSNNAQEAMEHCLEILNLDKTATKFNIIHVVNVAEIFKMVSPVEFISLVEKNLLMEGETFLAKADAYLAEEGYKNVTCTLKEGDPASEILNLARESKADIVVIGAKGRTAVEHFLIGSVSNRIAMHCPCSTLVVKPESLTD